MTGLMKGDAVTPRIATWAVEVPQRMLHSPVDQAICDPREATK